MSYVLARACDLDNGFKVRIGVAHCAELDCRGDEGILQPQWVRDHAGFAQFDVFSRE